MAIDAVYPTARDHLNFPEHLQEGLETHNVAELYLFGSNAPNLAIDITEVLPLKIDALRCHTSQFADRDAEFFDWVRTVGGMRTAATTSASNTSYSPSRPQAVDPVDPRYCPRCGVPIGRREVAGVPRPACDRCDFVHFADPKLAVVVLVESGDGSLLYTKRNHDPMLGAWAWPGGWVDRGEVVEAAAVREVREETDLEIELRDLLGVFSRAGEPAVLIAYRAVWCAANPGRGRRPTRSSFFAPDTLPPPAFPLRRRDSRRLALPPPSRNRSSIDTLRRALVA